MSLNAADIRHCGNHPEVVAVDMCVRCGSFVCGECLELIGEEPFCLPCYGRRDVTGRASTRATLALIIGAFSLFCGAPLGIVTLLLVWRERKAIERGAAPLSSRSFIKVARILGWV